MPKRTISGILSTCGKDFSRNLKVFRQIWPDFTRFSFLLIRVIQSLNDNGEVDCPLASGMGYYTTEKELYGE